MRKASKKTLGRTKSERKKQRDSWWWNKDKRKVLKEKKLAFKRMQKSMLEIDRMDGAQIEKERSQKDYYYRKEAGHTSCMTN